MKFMLTTTMQIYLQKCHLKFHSAKNKHYVNPFQRQHQLQKTGSVMVWGCICAYDKDCLLFCDGDGSIKANKKQKTAEILEQYMLSFKTTSFHILVIWVCIKKT